MVKRMALIGYLKLGLVEFWLLIGGLRGVDVCMMEDVKFVFGRGQQNLKSCQVLMDEPWSNEEAT